MPKKSTNALGYGCLVLFALPFLAGGLFMTWSLVSTVWLASVASGWEEVPATLTECELVESHGDDATTYRVEAEYRYEHGGRQYTGDRVGLSSMSDNVGTYHQDLYERLDGARRKGQTVPCYVDPGDPTQSLLDRELRPMMVVFHLPFVLGFTGVGAGLLVGAWWAGGVERRRAVLQEADPEKPWLWREDWAAGRIKGSFSKKLGFLLVFGLFWNVISLPIATLFFFGEKDAPWWVTPIVMLFPAIGLGILGWIGYALCVSQKYGRSRFQMASVPGVIGGRLSGVILASDKVEQATEVRLTLTCERTTGSGENQNTHVVWQDERVVDRFLDPGEPGRVGVPVDLVIPSDGVVSTDPEDRVAWTLRAGAELPGVDYQAEFEVPVFRTDDSQEGVTIDAAPSGDFEREQSLEELLKPEGVRVEIVGLDGVRYVSPPMQSPVALVVFLLVTIGTTIGAGVLVWNGVWFPAGICALFALVFGLILPGMALGSSDLVIDGDQWTCRNGLYGFRKPMVIGPTQIGSIATEKSSVQTQNTGKPSEKNVVARLVSGEQIVLVRSITGANAVRRLLADLRQRAGLDEDDA